MYVYNIQGGITVGYFKDDQLHMGTKFYGDGEIYEGTFIEGLLHGRGRRTTKEGVLLEGNFVDGKADGKMKVTMIDGKRAEVNYEEGKKVGEVNWE